MRALAASDTGHREQRYLRRGNFRYAVLLRMKETENNTCRLYKVSTIMLAQIRMSEACHAKPPHALCDIL